MSPKNKKSHAPDSVVILIPAYNEASVVGEVIRSIPQTVEGMPIHVVVIDDGSTDNTSEVAVEAGAKVIRHFLNMGAGGATTTGLQYARNNDFHYALTMDADGQHTVKDSQRVIKELKKGGFDVVIGSRLINSTGMPTYRVIGNKGLNFITYLIFRTTATDTQSGLKGFNRKALEMINIKGSGMEFCSEIIWRAKQQGLVVGEIPIEAIYTDYSLAKGQSNWNAFNIIKNLIKRKLLEFISV
jgi:glycosyltransferase involved in cell wall biosynthesis